MNPSPAPDPNPNPNPGPNAGSLHHVPARRRRPLVPDERRKRVRRACLPCRSNKLRCDGVRPCARCQKSGSSCLFVLPVVSRERAPQSSQPSERERLLESILRSHNIEVPTGDVAPSHDYAHTNSTNATVEKSTVQYGKTQDSEQDGGLDQDNCHDQRQGDESARVEESQPNHEQGASDETSVMVEHVPLPQTFVHDQSRTFFDGGFSAWAFFDSVHRRTTEEGASQSSSSSSRRETTAYRHFLVDPPEVLFGDLRASLLAALPPRGVLDFLSHTFFKYSQSNAFVVHPAIFTRKLDAFLAGTHEFDVQNRQLSRRPVEFICVLFMVLALGSQFADLEDDGADNAVSPLSDVNTDPSIASMDPRKIGTVSTTSRNPGWPFYQVSRRLLTDIVSSCSMTSIQACALQGTFLVTTSAHDTAYNVWGLAIRMSINMGLHRSFRGDVLHPHVRELRNRLWWSIYTQDRLFGFWLGRPTMFDDKEIDAPFPEDVPELKVEQPTGSVDGQIALIKLCRIIDSIVKKMYPNSSSPKGAQAINIDTYISLQRALEMWKNELPQSLQLTPRSRRGTVHLHMCQKHAMMLLTRTALSHSVATKGSNIYPNHQSHKSQFLHKAAIDCVRAATSTIDLLKDLRERRLISRYSCQDSLFCTAALCVLLLGAHMEAPGPEMKKIVIFGVSILRYLGEGNETAASSLGGIVRGFQPFFSHSDSTPRQGPAESCGVDDRAQGRRAWQLWLNQSPMSSASLSTDKPNGGLFQPNQAERIPDTSPDNWRDDVTPETLRDGPLEQPTTNVPDYQYLAFDNIIDTWTGGNPFWFSELDTAIEGHNALNQLF